LGWAPGSPRAVWRWWIWGVDCRVGTTQLLCPADPDSPAPEAPRKGRKHLWVPSHPLTPEGRQRKSLHPVLLALGATPPSLQKEEGTGMPPLTVCSGVSSCSQTSMSSPVRLSSCLQTAIFLSPLVSPSLFSRTSPPGLPTVEPFKG
jgi:hypothetical protein